MSRGTPRGVAMGRPRALAGPALTGRAAARGGGAAVGTRTPLVTPSRGRTAAGARRGPACPRGAGLAGARAAVCVVVLRAASCHAADFTGAPALAPARPAARARRARRAVCGRSRGAGATIVSSGVKSLGGVFFRSGGDGGGRGAPAPVLALREDRSRPHAEHPRWHPHDSAVSSRRSPGAGRNDPPGAPFLTHDSRIIARHRGLPARAQRPVIRDQGGHDPYAAPARSRRPGHGPRPPAPAAPGTRTRRGAPLIAGCCTSEGGSPAGRLRVFRTIPRLFLERRFSVNGLPCADRGSVHMGGFQRR